MKLAASAALATAALALPAVGASYSLTKPEGTSGGTYSQNFNALSTNGGTQATLVGTLLGLEFVEVGSATPGSYIASTGSSTGFDTYNFGGRSSTDRAFGTLGSEFTPTAFGFHFTNDTNSTINSLTVAYRGEQWRRGTSTADRLDFSYSTTATSLTSGTYTGADALDFASPALGSTDAAGTGNNPGYFKQIGPVTLAVSVPNGREFFLRWVNLPANGISDGLAVDDFSLGYTIAPPVPVSPPVAAPEPLSAAGAGLLLAAAALPRRRREAAPGRSGPRL